MDWALAIDRNREALMRIIAALFALAGLAEGGVVRFDRGIAVLPRHVYLAVLNVLRPAESAVRRLVIIAARALVSAARPGRSAPSGPIPRGGAWTQAFLLIDPLKRFTPGAPEFLARSMPRISVPGFFDPVFVKQRIPSPDDLVSATHLSRRLHALKRALDDLPAQARRLARWRARRDLARKCPGPVRPARLSPFRPGRPPGGRKRAVDEIDYVLRECHGLALDACARPDTS